MLKKYKQLISGVIIGITLSVTVSYATSVLTAQVADFPILVNGKAVSVDAVTINDRTYLPLRALGDSLGINVKWNEQKQQVEVATEEEVTTPTPAPTATPAPTKTGTTFYQKDKLSYANDNGVVYISFFSAEAVICDKNPCYQLDGDKPNFVRLMKRTKPSTVSPNDPVILDNIPIKYFKNGQDGHDYIDFDYFQNTILTAIK